MNTAQKQDWRDDALPCEITHMECKKCGELKHEFSEVEVRMPRGTALLEMCDDCCMDFLEDKDLGYKDDF